MIERGGLYYFTATVTQDCEMLNTMEIRNFFYYFGFSVSDSKNGESYSHHNFGPSYPDCTEVPLDLTATQKMMKR